jgi:hypothetical protein
MSIVGLGGSAFNTDGPVGSAQTDGGGEATIGLRLPIARALALRMELGDVVYFFSGEASPHNALTLSLGSSIVVGGQRKAAR